MNQLALYRSDIYTKQMFIKWELYAMIHIGVATSGRRSILSLEMGDADDDQRFTALLLVRMFILVVLKA